MAPLDTPTWPTRVPEIATWSPICCAKVVELSYRPYGEAFVSREYLQLVLCSKYRCRGRNQVTNQLLSKTCIYHYINKIQ